MSEPQSSLRKRVWSLIRPYWTSEERWAARLLLAVIVVLNLGTVYIEVLFNDWNNGFYNSLQNLDEKAFKAALVSFSYIAGAFIVVSVYNAYLNQMLQIKWRRWMTAHTLGKWLGRQQYYRMQLSGNVADNPDQRIAEDINQFINLTLWLSLGMLSSVVTLFSFLSILWRLSGAFGFAVAGVSFHIPGYMVWFAVLYAGVGTWLTFRIGKPLMQLNFDQQRYEADFRFSLVRLRENSESIAFYKGETQEFAGFTSRFASIFGNWWAIMKRQKMLGWFTSGYGQIAIIFPFVVAAPRYFAKEILLGDLMQTSLAFGKVQGSLSFFINAFSTNDPSVGIVNWKAVTDRLTGFNDSIRHTEEISVSTALECKVSAGKTMEASDLTIRLPDGSVLLEHVNLAVGPGDALLVTGRSGSGKSTLLRTLAGLWPFAEGRLSVPDTSPMFVPQKPYLPLGTLRQVLCYPDAPTLPDERLREVFSLCRLDHLAGKLDETGLWSHVLSPGEQQRIAFARILLARPDFLFLDEATSALDAATEAHLYGMLKERLPGVALISVGHREALRAWHGSELKLGES
jgi:putative ATP-binding cassette transporter